MRQQQEHQEGHYQAQRLTETSPSSGDGGTSKATIRGLVFQRNLLVIACTILSLAVLLQCSGSLSTHLSSGAVISHLRSFDGPAGDLECEINIGKYRGPIYHSVESGTIGEPKCLLTSKWISVSLHTVKFPGSDTTMDDWVWIDYHDRINVLVEDQTKEGEERKFLVFSQSKYALEGRTSLVSITWRFCCSGALFYRSLLTPGNPVFDTPRQLLAVLSSQEKIQRPQQDEK
jgi:hypothetical protein